MVGVKKLMRQVWYPAAHKFENSWSHGLETGVNNKATIYPIIMHDEANSAKNLYTNPEHASFSTLGKPNCYPESRVNDIFCDITYSLTKGALETDKLHAVRCAYMVIATAFKESLTVIDELSSTETQDVLELQSETTDRQCYPLYNGVDMPVRYTGAGDLNANVPGLTTDQKIEGVTFSTNDYYNALHYMTISGKLKKMQYGLKWFTLTRQHPTKRIRIHMKSSAKKINPYTFLGVMTYVPEVDTNYQIPTSGETTNINHVDVMARVRYNEWNQNFNMEKN